MNNLIENIVDFFYDIQGWFYWKYRLLKHYIRWIKRISLIDNFNGHHIYGLIAYQLKDVEYSMLNGYIDFTDSPEDLKSIRIAIKLAKRLGDGYHESSSFDRYYEKWRKNEPEDRDFMESLRRAISAEERADLDLWRLTEQRQRDRDLKWLLAIMQKYSQKWVD